MQTPKDRFPFVATALCVLSAVVMLILWRRHELLVKGVRQDVADLRAELASRDARELEWQTKLEEDLYPTPNQTTASSADSFAELERRLDQLTVQESNTLALVQSLASNIPQPESPEVSRQRRELEVTAMDDEVKTQQEKVDAAQQKVEQLATSWNVPDELSRMDVSVGLDSVPLKPYWPYFKARRERDELQTMLSLMKTKAAAERLDLDLETTKNASQ